MEEINSDSDETESEEDISPSSSKHNEDGTNYESDDEGISMLALKLATQKEKFKFTKGL